MRTVELPWESWRAVIADALEQQLERQGPDEPTMRLSLTDDVFLRSYIGAAPRTEWLNGTLERDDHGYILTCRDRAPRYEPLNELWPRQNRPPFPLETSLPGVFAVGDVRHNSVKRVASAVGAGALAISSAHVYLAEEVA